MVAGTASALADPGDAGRALDHDLDEVGDVDRQLSALVRSEYRLTQRRIECRDGRFAAFTLPPALRALTFCGRFRCGLVCHGRQRRGLPLIKPQRNRDPSRGSGLRKKHFG